MKKYIETKRRKPFDWEKAINDYKFGDIGSGMIKKSGSWVTCACGNQCAIIPRDWNGSPLDDELNYYGLQFAAQIENMILTFDKKRLNKYKKESLKTLAKIEKRSIVLINKINKKQK